jgi:hypothetical protein
VGSGGHSTGGAGGQSTVRAGDQSTVRARDQSTVEAWGQSTVEAWDQSTVEAWGQSTVRAWGQSTVRARGQSTVRAGDQSTVRAGKYVAIHRNGDLPKVTGGVLIQIPKIKTVEEFCDYYGIEVKGGNVILFKAVNEKWVSTNRVAYEPGTSVTCDDWSTEPRCGGGLHFSPRAFLTRKYSDGPKLLACKVKVKDIVVITDMGLPDKVKAKSCKVLHEVDIDGVKVEPAAVAA